VNKREHLINNLSIYGIYFEEKEDGAILIKVCYGLFLNIQVHTNGKVEIKEHPKGYNFFSGPIPMKFTNQLIISCILFIIACIYGGYVIYTRPLLTPCIAILLGMGSVLFIFMSLYYTIKLEAMKHQIMDWIR
jgi:hypothetical protein